MFGWFQRLLPKSGDFFVLFERHGAAMIGAAEALVTLTAGEGDRAKLLRGLEKACEKRPVSPRQLEEIADAAENLLAEREDREISAHELGAFLMERLHDLDQVAYVRFASVYRRFEDVDEFMAELEHLLDSRKPKKTR